MTPRRCQILAAGWIDVDSGGFLLRELAPGLTVDDVRAATGAPLRVARDVGEMTFGG
jgi:3-oxoacid CoA-transferase subunit B